MEKVMKKDLKDFGLLTLYYYQSAFEGTEPTVSRMLLTLKRIEIESWRMIQPSTTMGAGYLLLEMLDVVKV